MGSATTVHIEGSLVAPATDDAADTTLARRKSDANSGVACSSAATKFATIEFTAILNDPTRES